MASKLSGNNIALPVGNTAQRPTGANGMIRYSNTNSLGLVEYYNSSAWITLSPILDGSTSGQAAPSAAAIKSLTGTTVSGYYWINLPTVGATQVWCDMSGSSAWMLAMRCSSGGSSLGWSSAYWTNTSSLNGGGDPTTNIDYKNGALWQYWTASQMRMTGSSTASSYSSNPLTFGTFNNTPYNIFNAGNNVYSGQVEAGRSAWMSWFTNTTGTGSSVFDNQPNCNEDRINANYTYAAVRIGIALNNEGDCNTNDAVVGFGCYTNSTTELNSGGISWNPSNRYGCHGWLWVN